MKDLRDKVVMVTGAASGIGKATAVEFARCGADLAVSDLNQTGLADTVAAVEALGRKAVASRTDVSRPDEVERLVNGTVAEFGRIDIIMNNAGIALSGEMRHLSLQDWERIVSINLWGPIYGVHFALPHLMHQRGGHIVNVSSSAGLVASPGMSAYTTTKFGVVGLSEVLRSELAPYGIGVTVVCPGFVRTNIFQTSEVRGVKDPEAAKKIPSWLGIPVEACARDIVKAVRRNKFLIIPGPEMKFFYGCKRFVPPLYQGINKLLGYHIRRISKE
jgi:NAD(P)-dependent dehydrogenase (short-subunit alcohol dehydrogenase family)